MNVHNQDYNRIIFLISKETTEDLTSQEAQELFEWLSKHPDNSALYNRIRNSKNFESRNKEYQQIDIQDGWRMLNSKIHHRGKVKKLRRHFFYAAAILVPLMITGSLLFHLSNRVIPVRPDAQQISEIQHGKPRAILILEGGESVALDSSNNQLITEKDGTLIQKSNRTLNYSVPQSAHLKESNIYNTIIIPRGGEYNILLSDGTKVYLNSESQLKYPVQFAENLREVELIGEGYFEVTKNVDRPFIVKTKEVEIEVLGTSFNVNAYENTGKVLTTLVEGSVKINMSANSVSEILKPSEQATFNIYSGQNEINKVDINLYTAWKDGHLIFYDNRLEDIMVTLTRWYSADVLFKNASVKDLRFSGSLDRYGDIQQILDIIESTGKVNIEINNNTILFSEKK